MAAASSSRETASCFDPAPVEVLGKQLAWDPLVEAAGEDVLFGVTGAVPLVAEEGRLDGVSSRALLACAATKGHGAVSPRALEAQSRE